MPTIQLARKKLLNIQIILNRLPFRLAYHCDNYLYLLLLQQGSRLTIEILHH